MRVRPLALGLLLAAGGCTWSINRGEIGPPAQARPADAGVYAQARQFGIAFREFRWRRDKPEPTGFTIDVHNRSPHPVTVRLSQASRRAEQIGGPGRRSAGPITSGAGELPVYVGTGPHGPLDLTVPAGQKQTMWVLFEALELPPRSAETKDYYRELIVLPLAGGPELTIKVDDPQESPDYFPRSQPTGLSVFADARRFDTLALVGPPGLGWWYGHGGLKTTLSLTSLYLVDTEDNGTANPLLTAFGLELQWIPRGWYQGVYARGTVFAGDAAGTPWAGKDTHLAAEVGFAGATARVLGVPFSFRLGYTRVFDVAASRNGFCIGLDLPFIW